VRVRESRRGCRSVSARFDFGRRGGAAQQRINGPGDGVGVHSLQRSFRPIHLDHERIPGENNPVLDIHDARNPADGLATAGATEDNNALSSEKSFHFDRLRYGREVADQVLHQLRHLDFESGHPVSTWRRTSSMTSSIGRRGGAFNRMK